MILWEFETQTDKLVMAIQPDIENIIFFVLILTMTLIYKTVLLSVL